MKPDLNGKADKDYEFLEQVLDTLYDFGSGATKKKKAKKRKRCEPEDVPEVVCGVNEERGGEQDPTEMTVQNQSTKGATNNVAPTTGSAAEPLKRVEVVSFQDPAKRQRKTKQMPAVAETPPLDTSDKKQSAPQRGLSLEKARLEVHRFGITGYKKERQRVFEEERAIMLGARPPKRNYLNYKVLQQQIKEKKAKKEPHPDLKKKKKNTRDKDKMRTAGSSSEPTGQVGRFKNGMLVLSHREIRNIKGTTLRK
ncbi:uncharacterized protein C1orf131 homolog isoform X2 [Syngnathoides biaculeatus]|uniref:uncharacterized protein C1orf131 homolog isoform X2 n=1 Tax=Syngnathoides biaculeatus TaxID=300417 RepID=UPI002ADDF115|nr:uncharacterized protein C1orf131 homolog isoform X2 [Syngnathoides biaculeatus]